MKKHEKLITLYDLSGKPVNSRENVPIHYVKGEQASIQEFYGTDGYNDPYYRVYIGGSIKVGDEVHNYNELIPLQDFLNNQLALIRKGEETGNWNDLAIYQKTLGRYWEVPWYIAPAGFKLTVGEYYEYIGECGYPCSGYYREGDDVRFDNAYRVYGFYATKEEMPCDNRIIPENLTLKMRVHSDYPYQIKPSIKEFLKNYHTMYEKLEVIRI